MNYIEFLESKKIKHGMCGIDVDESSIHPTLYPFQNHIVRWALRKGRAAIFADCGLGKTLMQLEWAQHIHKHTGGRVLIVAPLAVASQTSREGRLIDVEVTVCRDGDDLSGGINITNYELLERFNDSAFAGVVLDESSILKNYSGKIRTQIIDMFRDTRYKLACTATPSPNDHMELGNHSEFLGALTRTEMLSTYFLHDGGDTSKWRLKGHAEDAFWKYISSWAVMLAAPEDIGYNSGGMFKLPPLNIREHIVSHTKPIPGMLFPQIAQTLTERRNARRDSIDERVQLCADIVNGSREIHIIWCGLNDESLKLAAAIDGAVEIKGSDSRDFKRDTILAFADGKIKALVTKPSIAGFGVNWQVCHNVCFVGLSDSYEQYYQAVRRCWRFGQKHPVNVHIITGELEGAVIDNIKRKDGDFRHMQSMMIKHMHMEGR